ncbi:SspB family protein [Dinoroseobacter sp. S124A]|uniref:SspB family protein n=1 Tax=Dinoroseobacter sp. S124A TaxID=3415128 RepID=UPI003C7E55EA
MADRLDYGNMMHRAMRSLIQDVLREVADGGLPGDHHFFITFDTQHPEVELSDWLRERYPDEMTIVLQHWFDGLEVRDADFSVILNFGDQPEALTVPLDAIRTFVDPSVEFGLRFENHEDSDDEAEEDATEDGPHEVRTLVPAAESRSTPPSDAAEDAEKPAKTGEAEIVSLDSFRK